MLNLIKTAEQIALTAKEIQLKVESTGGPINLSVAQLKKKLEALSIFPDETAIVRVIKSDNGSGTRYYGDTLTVYTDDDDTVKVFDATLKPVKGVDFVSYETGFRGYQIVKVGGQEFKINLSFSKYYYDNAKENGIKQGKGHPDKKLIGYRPHPTVPLKDLEKGDIYTVLEPRGKHRENGTQRYLVEDDQGHQFEIYENSSLRDLIAEEGLPCEFEIVAKFEEKVGTVVKVASPSAPNFADLAL